jgi:hypothetical protein
MNYSPKSTTKRPDHVSEPFVGGEVASIVQPGRTDLADWVELMEAVEALCPVWPPVDRQREGRYRL